MSTPTADAPIFIVGYSRSGTSLLRLMLNAHPRIHIAQESAFYQWLRPDRLRSCTGARDWFSGYARTASFRLLLLDPATIAAAIPIDLPRSAAGPVILPLLLSAKARRLGRARWGDKTPLHSQRLDAIFADFPDARVIHVTRHPVATVGSILRMPWGSHSALLNAVLYRGVTEAVARFADRVLVVRLEDLIAQPAGVLARVLDHVGEPWDDRVLQHDRYADTSEDPPLPWLTQAAAPVDRGARAPELARALVRPVERITASALARYGYTPTPLSVEPGLLDRLGASLCDLGRALRFVARLVWTAPRFDRPERIDALAQVRWLFRLNPSRQVPEVWREVPAALKRILED